MRQFNRHGLLDLMYICRVKTLQEQLPKGQEPVLFCDPEGNLTTTTVESSVVAFAENAVRQLLHEGKRAAALSIEIAPGMSTTFAVQLNAEQFQALLQIHQFACEAGIVQGSLKIPDHLSKYAAEIIKLGQSMRAELRKQCERMTQSPLPVDTPGLQDESASKWDAPTRYTEPNAAIFLKRLPPNNQTRPGMQRALILDYQGLFRIVRIPVEALDEAERDLEELRKTHDSAGVIALATNEEGFLMGPMGITEEEKEALDMVELYFETTGCSMNDIPTGVKMILARAKVAHSARDSQMER